jgi:ribosomal protein S18 acetylase RimI-like enzyme
VIVRPAVDADRQTIARIHAASWADSYREVIAPDFLADLDARMAQRWTEAAFAAGDLLLLAERDGEPLGFIYVRDGEPAFINVLHVLPGQRSNGIGARLMRAAARRLLAQGRKGACLDVLTTNHRAIALYQRLGGVPGAVKDKEVGGRMLPNLRIAFPDLTSLAG